MIKIEKIGNLPKALNAIARGFLGADTNEPEIWQCTPDEIKERMDYDDLVFQVVLDRDYDKFYIVGVGDGEREYQSMLIIHNKMHIPISSLYFAQVDQAWIQAEHSQYERKAMYAQPLVYNGDDEKFLQQTG